MALVTILAALPADGASPSGMLANTTGLVRLTISLSSIDERGQWQLCQKNADSGQWSFVPGALLTVGAEGQPLVDQLEWKDSDAGANFHVVQVSPQIPSGGSVNGAAGYLSAATVVSGPTMGASTVSTLLATGAITAQSTLSVAGALTASAALTVGTTLAVTGAATLSSTLAVTGAVTHSSTLTQTGIATFNAAPVFAAGLTASGAVANDFSGSTGTFLTSTGLNTIGGDLLMASGKVVGFGAPQALSGPGAINVTTRVTNYTSTGAAEALTLANGTRAGQLKTVSHIVDGGSGVITPATPSGFATATLTNVRDSVTFCWTGSAWTVASYVGATFA